MRNERDRKKGISMRFRWISLLIAVMMIITMSLSTVTVFADEENTLSQQTASQTSETVAESIDAPCNVKAKGISKSKIKVTWDSVDNADGYKVYRYNKSKDKYTCIKTIKNKDKCSYINSGLDTNTKKTYRVSAYMKNESGIITESNLSAKAKGTTYPRTIKVKAYAYSGGGTTASGKKATKGVIAVDPEVIKLGTKVYIPGYGYATAADTGGMIKGNIIDVYMNTNAGCIKWGVRYITIKIYD